jgi:hypothetical protein
MMDQCLSMMPRGVGHRYALLWKLHSVKVWLTLDALRRSVFQSRAYLIKKIVLASRSTDTRTPKYVLWITKQRFGVCRFRSVSLGKMLTTGSNKIQGIFRKAFGLVLICLNRMSSSCGQLRRATEIWSVKCSIIAILGDRSTRQYGRLVISTAPSYQHSLVCSTGGSKRD